MEYYTADRETGTFIEKVSSYDEGLIRIKQYEIQDIKENCYSDNYYDIVDKNHCHVDR